MRRWFLDRVLGATFLAVAAGGWLCLSGCGGGDPAGDDAYSQKFEKPAGAAEGTGSMPDPASERRDDIKKAQEQTAKKSSSKK
jgi:hypothetical protein